VKAVKELVIKAETGNWLYVETVQKILYLETSQYAVYMVSITGVGFNKAGLGNLDPRDNIVIEKVTCKKTRVTSEGVMGLTLMRVINCFKFLYEVKVTINYDDPKVYEQLETLTLKTK